MSELNKQNIKVSGNDYRVATFSKSKLTVIGIIMQIRKSISNMSKFMKKANRYITVTGWRTEPSNRKASLLRIPYFAI